MIRKFSWQQVLDFQVLVQLRQVLICTWVHFNSSAL